MMVRRLLPIALWTAVSCSNIIDNNRGGTEVGPSGGEGAPDGGGASDAAGGSPAHRIRIDVVSSDVPLLATFQSHNPKLYCDQSRCFLGHLEHRSDPSDTRADVFDIRLQMSTDSGLTFSSIALDPNQQARPPSVVGDDNGNFFVLYPENVTETAGFVHFLRYSSANGYAGPIVNAGFAQGGAGKFAAAYSAWRDRIYYFTNNNSWGSNQVPNLFVLDREGVLQAAITLTSAESLPGPLLRGNHYPHLTVSGSTVVAAWTSTNQFVAQIQGLPPYESIHAIRTEDGGASWLTLAGTPLGTPVLSSLAGPATRIVYTDEADGTAHKWLSNVLAYGGALHFFYLTRPTPDREHYVRVDLGSGSFTANYFPTWTGGSTRIHALDGVFVDGGPLLYAIGSDDASGQLVVLASSDTGSTWHDQAAVPVGAPGCSAYAIDAHRRTLANGSIVGVFTRLCPDTPNALIRFIVE